MCVERPTGYFTLDQDVALWERERSLLTHRNVEVVGQNYLYDAQYFARRRGYVPSLRHDTLFMQHCAWAGLPKGLDFMSSMYRKHHVYWKEEGKEWNQSIPEENLWAYNCEDAIATYEIAAVLEQTLKKQGLWDTVYQQQMQLWRPALDMMLRGVRIDQLLRGKIANELLQAINSREAFLHGALGYKINLDSPKQVHNLFYDQFKCTVIKNRKTKRPTCDEDALQTFARREPLLKPFTDMIVDIRGLGAMMSNVILAQLDFDGRIRSELNPAGAETYRWTSRKNAFGGGTNLMNWTKGDEDKEKEAIKHTFPVPNVRKLAIPDTGFEVASIDLTGADAQTIAWEAGDEELKQVFRENKIKIHAHNAMQMFKGKVKTGYEQPYYDLCRTGVHLVNYLGGIDELAGSMGISYGEASEFRDYWFGLHPKIPEFHDRVQQQLSETRMVKNAFGYQRFYFDRMEHLLPAAVAWIGQSTTAIVTDRAIINLYNDQLLRSLDFQLLFQVHDEIVFQYPQFYRDRILARVYKLAHITVPYPDPLIIPWGLKTSTKSWGECEKREWPSETMTTG
jgi:DNA polymerase-1